MIITLNFNGSNYDHNTSITLLTDYGKALDLNAPHYLSYATDYIKTMSIVLKSVEIAGVTVDYSQGLDYQIGINTQKLYSDVKHELKCAQTGFDWLSKLFYGFAGATHDISVFNDPVKGPLKHYLILSLLDDYLKQTESLYNDGRIKLPSHDKELAHICNKANLMIRDALLLWNKQQNANLQAYIPFDNIYKEHVHNKAKVEVITPACDKRAFMIAKEIAGILNQKLIDFLNKTNLMIDTVIRDMLRKQIIEFDQNPYSACIFIQKFIDMAVGGELRNSLVNINNIRRNSLSLYAYTKAICMSLSWVLRNVPESSPVIADLTMSYIYDGKSVSDIYRVSRLHFSDELTFSEKQERDEMIRCMGLDPQTQPFQRFAKLYEMLYSYINTLQAWSIQKNVPEAVNNIITGRRQKLFFKARGFDGNFEQYSQENLKNN